MSVTPSPSPSASSRKRLPETTDMQVQQERAIQADYNAGKVTAPKSDKPTWVDTLTSDNFIG